MAMVFPKPPAGTLYADRRSEGVKPPWYETVAFGCAPRPISVRRRAWHEALSGSAGLWHTLSTFAGSVYDCPPEAVWSPDAADCASTIPLQASTNAPTRIRKIIVRFTTL